MISKAKAKYVPEKEYDGKRPCVDCSMFKEPNKCTLVRGHIEAGATCSKFQPKRG